MQFTCIGELADDNFVKPTMSEKYIVTDSYTSASTVFPAINFSATDLHEKTRTLYGELSHIIVNQKQSPFRVSPCCFIFVGNDTMINLSQN